MVADGHIFDSKAEYSRYLELNLLQHGGLISELELQPEYELIPAYTRTDGKKIRHMVYRADFRYKDDNGQIVVEDVKGVETAVFKLKRKLLEWKHPTLILQIVKV
ncbi:hypothetical protein LCGC14_1528450 [marine sediment metagenome]|uniref:DUF1064 domain-containing protein n=1 Tax=marine sediment metagenome TaxID=412755 RepID=A0A0F9IWL3_9ZZZZ